MNKSPDDHLDIAMTNIQIDNFTKAKNIDEHTNEYVSEMVLAINE